MSHSIPNPIEQPNIPSGYCHCGCGQLTPIAKRNRADIGHIKGQPTPYISGHTRHTRSVLPEGTLYCSKCASQRPLSEFKLQEGHFHSWCNDCCREYRHQQHYKNQETEIEQSREYRKQNKQRLLEADRKRREDEEFRGIRNETAQEWREKNREHIAAYDAQYYVENQNKIRARTAVAVAILQGKLPPARLVVCERCRQVQAAQYHHRNGYDTEYWLDVEALCMMCHGKEHWV